MSWLPWFSFIQSILVLAGGILTIVAVRGFQTGRWTQTLDKTEDIIRLNQRLDRAGHQISELASTVQGLDHRFRQIFVDREIFHTIEQDLRGKIVDNRSEIDRLWDIVRQRRNRERRES